MSGSNSLLSNFQANNAQINRLNVQSLQQNNYSNATKDDDLLVLITLNIKNANIIDNKIEFNKKDLKLTQWSNRTLNSETKYNFNTTNENIEAYVILNDLFNKDIQGKYNFTDNPPNFILIANNDDYYEILTGMNSNDDKITLYYEPQNNNKILSNSKNTNCKIIIDLVKLDIVSKILSGNLNDNVKQTIDSINNQLENLKLITNSINSLINSLINFLLNTPLVKSLIKNINIELKNDVFTVNLIGNQLTITSDYPIVRTVFNQYITQLNIHNYKGVNIIQKLKIIRTRRIIFGKTIYFTRSILTNIELYNFLTAINPETNRISIGFNGLKTKKIPAKLLEEFLDILSNN